VLWRATRPCAGRAVRYVKEIEARGHAVFQGLTRLLPIDASAGETETPGGCLRNRPAFGR
jgi:hypothetical protein